MIVLAIILAVLALLLLTPLGVRFSFDGQKTQLAILFGPFALYRLPSKKEPDAQPKKKKKPKKAKKQAAPAQPAQKKRLDFATLRRLLVPFLQLVRDFLDSVRRHLTIRRLKLHIDYGADNPADTAIRYGQAWALIGMASPILDRALCIRKSDVKAIYNDAQTGFAVDAEILITVLLFELLGMGLKYGLRALRLLLPLLAKKKKASASKQDAAK